jgi:hypothetical protein
MLQLNKNLQDITRPATLEFPQLKTQVVIGCSQTDVQQDHLTFSIYQPQILRILKTLEVIGLFNEFNQGALSVFYCKTLTKQEAEDYLTMYQEWHCICQDRTQAKLAEKLREKMLRIEADVDCATQIIDIRNVAQKKIRTKDGHQKELDDLEKKIKQKITEKIGWGLFSSADFKRTQEKEIRDSFAQEIQRINNKFVTQTQHLSENVLDLVSELKAEEEEEAAQ